MVNINCLKQGVVLEDMNTYADKDSSYFVMENMTIVYNFFFCDA